MGARAQKEQARAGDDPFRRARRNGVLALLVGVPLAFDAERYDTFELSKATLLGLGLLALGVLWVVSGVGNRRPPLWRNGLQWPLLALAAWAVVTTATSASPHLSVRGFANSWDGMALVLALAALVFVVGEAVGIRQLKLAVAVLWLGTGGLAVLYAGVQLHDRVLGGNWDPLDWGDQLEQGAIFSVLGNPNHLAGLIAMLLPLGLVLLLVDLPWPLKVVGAAVAALGIAELLYTRTRGAWLATLVSLVVLVVLLRREVTAHRRTALAVGGAVAGAALVGVLAVGSAGSVWAQFRSSFDLGGHTAVERVELWRIAWRMGTDHPIVGVGPDLYRVPFNRYQTERFVREDGPDLVANGPHNVFFNQLATQGFPGLGLLLVLLGVAGLRAAGAWRRLARLLEERKPEPERQRLAETRLLLAGLVASAVAYLVQASFNVQVVSLSFGFFAVLGLIAVVALDAGVPDTLRPRMLLSPEAGERADPKAAVVPAPVGGRARRERGPTDPDGWAVLAGVMATAVALLGAWLVTRPYRADARFVQAERNAATAVQLGDSGQALATLAVAQKALGAYEQAIDLDPWEPRYRSNLGQLHFELGRVLLAGRDQDPTATRRAAEHFRAAQRRYREAVTLSGESHVYLRAYGEVLVALTGGDHPGGQGAQKEAVAIYRRAVAANPWSPWLSVTLATLHQKEGDNDEAAALLQRTIERHPHDVQVLVTVARAYEQGGQRTLAKGVWRRALELTPSNTAIREAAQA